MTSELLVFCEPSDSSRRILLMKQPLQPLFKEQDYIMDLFTKPYVHLSINAVDTVVFDPEGRLDSERYDHYGSFTEARDAALSSIEVMLDEEDYDGEDHREELERMLGVLESSASYEELERQPHHRWLLERRDSVQPAAA
jgi:hypothetical protein